MQMHLCNAHCTEYRQHGAFIFTLPAESCHVSGSFNLHRNSNLNFIESARGFPSHSSTSLTTDFGKRDTLNGVMAFN